MRRPASEAVSRALRWVRRNPSDWETLFGMCRSLKDAGVPVTRGSVFTLAMQRGMDVSEASAFRRDHNLWSVLARYMAMLDPSMLSAIRFRASEVDKVDLAAAWREQVGPADFAAGSLAEARLAWEGAVA